MPKIKKLTLPPTPPTATTAPSSSSLSWSKSAPKFKIPKRPKLKPPGPTSFTLEEVERHAKSRSNEKRDSSPAESSSEVEERGDRTPENRRTPEHDFNENDDWDIVKRGASDTRRRFSPTNSIASNATSIADTTISGEFDGNDSIFGKDLEDDDEPMDWDEIDPGLLEELHRCRQEVASSTLIGSPSFVRPEIGNKNASTNLFIVVDTNVWICHLAKLKEMLANPGVVLYVPWTVLKELDRLKSKSDKTDVKSKAQAVNNYINDLFQSGHPRISGQSGVDEKQALDLFEADSADDRILQACLQVRGWGVANVHLYTNDRNLAAKAQTFGGGIQIFNDKIELVTNRVPPAASSPLPSPLPSPSTSGVKSLASDYVANQNAKLDQRQRAVHQNLPQVRQEQLPQPPPPPSSEVQQILQSLKKLIESVWGTSLIYVCSYARFLNVGVPIDFPRSNEFREVGETNCKTHMVDLLNLLVDLEQRIAEVLAVEVAALAVSSKPLTSFHTALTSFLNKLDKVRPIGHPAGDTHPPIAPQISLEFLRIPGDRDSLQRQGLQILQQMISILRPCLDKVQNTNNAASV